MAYKRNPASKIIDAASFCEYCTNTISEHLAYQWRNRYKVLPSIPPEKIFPYVYIHFPLDGKKEDELIII